MVQSSRQNIYYWKCDRAAAFHGTAAGSPRERPERVSAVQAVVERVLGQAASSVRDGGGQGNHVTFIAEVAGASYFVRIEDGPEQDDYMAVESFVLDQVRGCGVPSPRVFASDASRALEPFAWQVLEHVPYPDLNRHFKAGTLAWAEIARELGRLVATWQRVPVAGFGPFDVEVVGRARRLQGLHGSYADYFFTRFEEHLHFLVTREFLSEPRANEIRRAVEAARPLTDLHAGCLVHKDLALWNVMGTGREIAAVIDWDDCVAGDPMDDLALLGCFHDGAFLRAAFEGYAAVRPLPSRATERFWLHLLRNMLFKAVIRVGAGYFHQDSRFFLIGAAGSGASLRDQTLARLDAALRGLRDGGDPFTL